MHSCTHLPVGGGEGICMLCVGRISASGLVHRNEESECVHQNHVWGTGRGVGGGGA